MKAQVKEIMKVAVKEQRSLIDENARLMEILYKLGACPDCGEHYDHEITAPFASCDCHTSEWAGEESPYQKLQRKVYTQGKELIHLKAELAKFNKLDK